MRKKSTAQKDEPGSNDRALGYATKARPGPNWGGTSEHSTTALNLKGYQAIN